MQYSPEEFDMKKVTLCLFALLIVIVSWQMCLAETDLEMLKRIELNATPIDVAVSDDGLWVYVLTDTARINVYNREGELQGSVAVPEGSRQIAVSPIEGAIYIGNSKDRTLQIVRINLEHTFSLDNAPTLGPANAPVTIVEFTDFECSYCARLAPVLEEVHKAYPEKVRIVFKNFPLFRIHRFAIQAALAGLAAQDQGKFWPFEERLFQNYNQLNPQKIEEIRKELGLDAERFKARMNDPALKNLIRQDLEEGNAAGVTGTPTVFINGKKYQGQRSLEGFKQAIEAALAGKEDKS
jgi:protein-disulfide isomerase